jgi:hypothetical protein
MKVHTQRGFAPLVIILLVVALGGGGVYAYKANANKKAEKAKVEMENAHATSTNQTMGTSSAKTLHITLNEQNGSGQNGTAVITEVNGKAKVIVNLPGKPSQLAQPSHIHVGTCATIGAVKYPLTNVATGSAQTTLDISLDQLLAQLPLALNVHKSVAEISVYSACGDIGTTTVKSNEKKTASTTVNAKLKVQ